MHLRTLACLAAAALLPAQEVDVKAELAKQNARIAELEQKLASKPEAKPEAKAEAFKFPAELTPYILIDATLGSKTNATADGRTKVDFMESWFSGSRWGLKGAIKTNVDGLSVIYKLESEYFLYDGEQGKANTLFNRDAWLGIKSKELGQLTFGRQNTLARDFAVIYGDPFAHAEVNYDEGGWTNNNNFKSLVYYAGAVSVGSPTGGPAQTRIDKGVVWKKVTDGGFAMGAAYNLNYEPNTTTKNSTASMALGYNAKAFHLAGFYTQANNNGFTQKSASLGGNVSPVAWLRLNAGYFHYTAEQGLNHPDRRDSAFTVSASIQTDPKWSYYLGFQSMKADDAGLGAATGAWQNPFADTANKAYFVSGRRDTTYGAVRRHLSKKMEAYVVFDYLKLHDAFRLSATNPHDSQTEFAIGMRIRAL
ncbi:porin [Geothrix terrae]|uniref:porin n=1 Tax=Geothrix terrae TaxID=2922720 RepID=UPI001FAD4127|nr:porin [Geothrix terrae]